MDLWAFTTIGEVYRNSVAEETSGTRWGTCTTTVKQLGDIHIACAQKGTSTEWYEVRIGKRTLRVGPATILSVADAELICKEFGVPSPIPPAEANATGP